MRRLSLVPELSNSIPTTGTFLAFQGAVSLLSSYKNDCQQFSGFSTRNLDRSINQQIDDLRMAARMRVKRPRSGWPLQMQKKQLLKPKQPDGIPPPERIIERDFIIAVENYYYHNFDDGTAGLHTNGARDVNDTSIGLHSSTGIRLPDGYIRTLIVKDEGVRKRMVSSVPQCYNLLDYIMRIPILEVRFIALSALKQSIAISEYGQFTRNMCGSSSAHQTPMEDHERMHSDLVVVIDKRIISILESHHAIPFLSYSALYRLIEADGDMLLRAASASGVTVPTHKKILLSVVLKLLPDYIHQITRDEEMDLVLASVIVSCLQNQFTVLPPMWRLLNVSCSSTKHMEKIEKLRGFI